MITNADIRPPRPINLRKPRWIEIRESKTGRLLFRYDPQHRLVEIQRQRRKTVIDLRRLENVRATEY